MSETERSKRKPFSIFRSAKDEAEMKGDEAHREDQSWSASSTVGQIVATPGADLPYKVVLTKGDGESTEHGFATIREAEDFIRRNTPRPPARSTTYDHGAE